VLKIECKMDVTDLRLYALNATALSITFTDIEPLLKVILLLLSIGYTLIRIFTHLKGPEKK